MTIISFERFALQMREEHDEIPYGLRACSKERSLGSLCTGVQSMLVEQ